MEELRLRRGLPFVAIMMCQKGIGRCLHIIKNCFTLQPFQIYRLLEIELKCYPFHISLTQASEI